MRKAGRRLFVSSLVVASFFGAATIALPDPSPTSSAPVRDLAVSDIVIPQELGYVLERHQPSLSTRLPILVLIQEAHTNYEAETRIIAILKQLIDTYRLKLILVEGGQEDVGLAYLRHFGPPENRKQVAEKYLKAGILSAEEYLDITLDAPLVLWGVEDKPLYQQNVEAFLDAESLQESIKPVLASVREAAESLKGSVFDPELTDLEAKVTAFSQQQLGLADYAPALELLAKRRSLHLNSYPHLTRFLEVRRLEQAADFSQAQREQQALIGRLSEVAPEEKLEDLVHKGSAFKEGKASALEFYTTLTQLAASSNIALATYPNLSSYVHYLTESGQINATLLSKELDAIAAELRTQLSSSSADSQQLSSLLEELDLVEKLLEFRLSPDEHRRLGAVDFSSLASRWAQFVNVQLARQGQPPRSFQALRELAEKAPQLERFYDLAQQRDERLVQNALAKLQESNEPIAVLITGGFHAPELIKRLTDQGVGTVVVAPKVTTPTDERLYRAVVKYKSGQGSFDDVMALVATKGQ
jgi:hypothetical protein